MTPSMHNTKFLPAQIPTTLSICTSLFSLYYLLYYSRYYYYYYYYYYHHSIFNLRSFLTRLIIPLDVHSIPRYTTIRVVFTS